jgi:hypothetical protein
MRVVITGCAGFIGSSLCNHLLNCGKKVIGIDNFVCGYKENMDNFIDRQSFEFHEISITDKSLINIIQKDDIVIHLAAISSLASNQENPYFSYNNNVAGTANLLESCRYNGVKYIIFASTSAIYENNDVWNEFNESMLQKRYQIESEKYKNYINNQVKNGLSVITPLHCACGFMIRNMKHEKTIDINTTWYKHIQECGIQDQISFFFIKQFFTEYILPFTEIPFI